MFEEAKEVKKITMANAAAKNKGVALKAKSKKKKLVEEDDDENDDEEEDKEDGNVSYCLMAKTRKVMLPSNPPSSDDESSGTSSSDDEDMFKGFSKKAMLHVSKLMKALKAKEKTLKRQEDLLILEKEKCLALESQLELEKEKVASLTMHPFPRMTMLL
uniref:No apical meristem-associated C-terminal domain-containing protein n=1 Tax=Leersia perrieri TaxID=77586 RepID=A0A0D9XQW8_9ORYZ